jgi:adenine-specific DNA-methyltransferase
MKDNTNKDVKIRKAKGRPMLTWAGKRPLSTVKAYPAQHIESFNVALSDTPARKQDLVEGEYELDAPPEKATGAIKVIDMLGEKIILTEML